MVQLLERILEDLQLKLHDNMAAAMQKTDVCNRQFVLSKEDKHLLHKMFSDARNECLRDYYSAEAGLKKVDEYQALMNRLLR